MLIVIYIIIKNSNIKGWNKYNMKFKNVFFISSVIVVGITLIMFSNYFYKKDISKTEDIPQVISSESPLGFSGASMNKLELYSNGDAYLIKYDGNGYESDNIIEKNIVARNVSSIDVNIDENSENFGAIILYGDKLEVIESKYSWIIFK
jgi:hypothetical protein